MREAKLLEVGESTLLKALDEASIFYVDRETDGTFEFGESCDRYFKRRLTKDQVIALANELLALAA